MKQVNANICDFMENIFSVCEGREGVFLDDPSKLSFQTPDGTPTRVAFREPEKNSFNSAGILIRR